MTLSIENYAEILFVRHGQVDFSWPETCLGFQFDQACLEYQKAGLRMDSFPGENLLMQLRRKKRIWPISSTLPRAIESMQRLLNSDEFQRSDLLVEFELPQASRLGHSLPPKKWIGQLVEQFNRHGYESEQKNVALAARIDAAIHGILNRALHFDLVVLVGHAIFNGILVDKLMQNGWIVLDESGHEGYWSWKRLKNSVANDSHIHHKVEAVV